MPIRTATTHRNAPVRTPARRGLLPAVALAVLAPLALAPAAKAAPGCGPRHPATLTTQGEGKANVQPDIATVSVGVTVQAPTAQQAMTDNATRQTAVIDALKAQGIEPRDIQTSGLNLSPLQDYSREGQPPVITGYQAQNMVTITVRDLASLGGVLDRLVTAGANEVQGISFGREDAQATQDEALKKAVENARHTAEMLAGASGLELGGLVSLNNSGPISPPAPMYRMAAQDSAAAGATPVEAGELSFTAMVGATFELTGDGAAGPGKCDWQKGRRDRKDGPREPKPPMEPPVPTGAAAGAAGDAPGDASAGVSEPAPVTAPPADAAPVPPAPGATPLPPAGRPAPGAAAPVTN